MNTKKTKKKLALNKITISTLETTRMKEVLGGIDTIISGCLRCPPWWTDFCSDTCENCGIQTIIC
jgi:hypothetical protein